MAAVIAVAGGILLAFIVIALWPLVWRLMAFMLAVWLLIGVAFVVMPYLNL